MILLIVVLLGLFVLECVLAEVEHFGWATATLLLTLVGLGVGGHYHWFGLPSLLEFVKDHGLWTLAYAGAYVVVGIVWSFVKWFSYLMSFRDAFRKVKEGFLTSKNLDPKVSVPDNMRDEFQKWSQSNARRGQHRDELWYMERPRAAKNKSRITAWAAFWPFSFIGTLLNDPVRRIVNFLFEQFKGLYQKMSDRIFAKDVELK